MWLEEEYLKRQTLSQTYDHPELEEIAKKIQTGKYFSKIELELLVQILREGTLVTLNQDDYLIREGDDENLEMYILVEGALAVEAQGKFILRLEHPGDVIGELAVLHPAPRSADVISETECTVVAFTPEVFSVEAQARYAPIFYVLFAHIMAAKLRVTTAQSMLRKNDRVVSNEGNVKVAMIDSHWEDRIMMRGVIETNWPQATIIEYEDPLKYIENPTEHQFALMIVDVSFPHAFSSQQEAIQKLLEACKLQNASIYVLSEHCQDSMGRDEIIQMGADDAGGKPFAIFDVKHAISRFKVWFYKNQELDKIEHDAETDRLTGLANRRRLDEFLDALVTLYSENQQPFSLIITDVDNFKHYNDTNGHQMGDVVLSRVGAIFAENVRRGDLAARFGGEEFVMVLPNCPHDSAMMVAEKLRRVIEKNEFPHQEQQPLGNLTSTFGVATYPGPKDVEELLKWADDCLYEGKERGRNVVVSADELKQVEVAEKED